MKTVKLNRLVLNNFKKCKKIEIKFSGETTISGDNETGKTTVADAFSWLLFDKDSSDKKDFNIKTLDKKNNPIHHLEHAVLGELEIDGNKTELKKIYKEKWTKPRGSKSELFGGHTTTYYINDVPAKKKEYNEFIADICDEDLFKLVTKTNYFSEILKWQDARKMLFDMVDVQTDEDIIRSNSDLEKLLPAFEKFGSIDNIKKTVSSKISLLNKEIDVIPTRIDEASKSLIDLSLDFALLEKQKEEKEKEIKKIEAEIKTEEEKKRNIDLELQKKNKLKNKLNELENNLKNDYMKDYYEEKKVIMSKENKISQIDNEINLLQESEEFIQKTINVKDKEIKRLRKEVIELKQEKFEKPDKEFVCPTCKQKLSDNNIKEQLSKLENNFNREKNSKIHEIQVSGKTKVSENKKKNEDLGKNKDKQKELADQKAKLEKELADQKAKLEKPDEFDASKNKEYIELKKKINSISESLFNDSIVLNLKENIKTIENEINVIKEKLYEKTQNEKTQKRIQELQDEQEELTNKKLQFEEIDFLLEQFTIKKVELLEKKINNKFELVEFKLFETQINGGINDICVPLLKGVPYKDVNSAGKVQIGLDIIKTMSDHYRINAPIFVDNRESTSKIPEIETQIINLKVVEGQQELKIEGECK